MLESQKINNIFIKQKNWLISQITEKDFWELHINLFRSQNAEGTIFFCNEDTKNIIPYMKDILNRKHKFIEILYLKIILGVVAFLMLLIIINIYTTFNIKNQANTITKIQTEIPQNNILNEFKIK